MTQLIIDNKKLEDYGLVLEKEPALSTPERDVQFTQVPGRLHGALTRSLGWKDLKLTVNLAFVSLDDLRKNLRATHNLLYNARRIWLENDSEVFYLVKATQISSAPIEMESVAEFSVTFICDPFVYAKTYKQEFKESFTITNRSNVVAEPWWRLDVSGDCVLSVNGNETKFSGINSFVEIDSQTYTAIRDEHYPVGMIGKFPMLQPGINKVQVTSGNVSTITIDPRWRWLP